MNDRSVIATKNRYGFLKKILMIVLTTLEFFLVWGHFADYDWNESFVFLLVGYFLFAGTTFAKAYGKKLYLKYETGLSLVVKCILINVVAFFFVHAVLPNVPLPMTILGSIVLIAANILTGMVVNKIGNILLNKSQEKEQPILYIYGNEEAIRSCQKDNVKDTFLSATTDFEYIKARILDFDYIYLHDVKSKRRNALIKYCYEKQKMVYFTTKLSDVFLRASSIAQDMDSPVYYCARFGLSRMAMTRKRIFDVVCASIALVVLSPLFAVVAIKIKKEDGGPVIYRQIRCTENNREFQIYKFRSMRVVSEEHGAQLCVPDDERLTKIGRFIRDYKIDELPQLINIIKGDMSIVGPRPERPELIVSIMEEVPEFALRTSIKAGLTGYAQVRGYYDTEFLDKLKWDLLYIENYSFLLDLKIIVMTVFVLFQRNMKEEL